jgi:hypothetical protein
MVKYKNTKKRRPAFKAIAYQLNPIPLPFQQPQLLITVYNKMKQLTYQLHNKHNKLVRRKYKRRK